MGIAFSHYRNGFTDNPIDTKVIEIEEDVEERSKKLQSLYEHSLITYEEYEKSAKRF